MTKAYPIILIPEEVGFTVYIPDFDVYTQGDDLIEAVRMSQDGIGMMGIGMEDNKVTLPEATPLDELILNYGESACIVKVDFDEYRKKMQEEQYNQ